MGIASIIIKKDGLKEEIESLERMYKPIGRSAFRKITKGFMEHLDEAESIARNNETRNGTVGYLCENAQLLDDYITMVSNDETFREYEMEEPFGIFARRTTPFSLIPENEVREIMKDPAEYVSKTKELYRNNYE